MNYFELFQIPISLNLDTAQLAVRYRELQRQFHPDNVAAQADAIKLEAMQQSVEINSAYNTLKLPLARRNIYWYYRVLISVMSSKPSKIPLFDGTTGMARRAG